MWIVIHGNPIDGFSYHGVWETEEDAFTWGMHEFEAGDDWWATKVIIANPDFNDDEFKEGEIVDVDPKELDDLIAARMPRQVMFDLSEINEIAALTVPEPPTAVVIARAAIGLADKAG